MHCGALSQFLPAVVERLTPDMRDKTYKFFEDVVRTLQCTDKAGHTPSPLLARVREAMGEHSRPRPILPSFEELGYADKCDYSELRDRDQEYNYSIRHFTCPMDLHFVAQTGLLFTHWASLVTCLIGTTRAGSAALPTSGLFNVEHDLQEGSSGDEQDESSSDDE